MNHAVIAVAALSPFVLTPERLASRWTAAGKHEYLRRTTRWASQSRSFWVLTIFLSLGLPAEIRNVAIARHIELKVGHLASALLNASVILQLLIFRKWSRAQA